MKKHFDIWVQLDDYNNKCYLFRRATPHVEETKGKAVIVKDSFT